jgi:hypothetical protein
VIASVCSEKSQEGVRMPTGRWPQISSSLSAARICKLALVFGGEGAVELVDPGMDADLVPLGHHPALLVGVQHRDDGGHEEGGRARCAFSRIERMRGMAAREPYSPWLSLPGEEWPQRSVWVS